MDAKSYVEILDIQKRFGIDNDNVDIDIQKMLKC